ncbi:hypothetical protein [Hyalangium versicolor]|uniref:hypothetical protein n=1 Tax=Hyalangium versicolor TaxID=2861190 RepID=UPI001CCB5DD9|nr:hypothetical protein [Hyalangium versicolor]
MKMMAKIYELVSPSGATVALVVLLLLSLGISMALYAALVRRSERHTPFQTASAIQVPFAALLSTGVFALLFGPLFATTLQGFYRVELLDDEVRLHYLFPAHTVTVSRLELTDAERVPSHKGRWHLRLRTQQGDTYQSSLANDRAVLESWEGVHAYLENADAP